MNARLDVVADQLVDANDGLDALRKDGDGQRLREIITIGLATVAVVLALLPFALAAADRLLALANDQTSSVPGSEPRPEPILPPALTKLPR